MLQNILQTQDAPPPPHTPTEKDLGQNADMLRLRGARTSPWGLCSPTEPSVWPPTYLQARKDPRVLGGLGVGLGVSERGHIIITITIPWQAPWQADGTS